MATCAQVILYWGEAAIAVHRLAPGATIAISEHGTVMPHRGMLGRVGVTIRMNRDGASACGAGRVLAIPAGGCAEIAIRRPRSAAPYRSDDAHEPEPLAVRIEVPPRAPAALRRPGLPGRAWLAVASAAVAHAAALAISASAMPAVEPLVDLDTDWMRITLSTAPSFLPEPAEAPDDGGGDAPQLCQEFGGPMIGYSIAVEGPQDNPDPHIARMRTERDELAFDGIGLAPGAQAGDRRAPIMPWGREDALGNDNHSANGTLFGPVSRDYFTCFGCPPLTWDCSEELPPPPTLSRLGLPGIGDDPAPSPERWTRRRPARVAMTGGIQVAANVPRWVVAAYVRESVERSRACYERALADAPTLTGRMGALFRVSGEKSSVELEPTGDVAGARALRCCIEYAHSYRYQELPVGTIATARYAIELGSVTAPKASR